MNRLLKIITIILGGVYLPLSLYIGYCFGAGEYQAGYIAIGIYTLLIIIDGCIFWRLIDKKGG